VIDHGLGRLQPERCEARECGLGCLLSRLPSVSKRRPRSCGLTIHPSLGCSLRCAYCYLWEMGLVVPSPAPNLLPPDRLVRDLRRNPPLRRV